MSVFVSAVFVVLETCVYCDLCFLRLHIVFSVFVVARVFVVLNITRFFFDLCLFVVCCGCVCSFSIQNKLCL